MQQHAPITLSLIDANALLAAIGEFNDLGRKRFLRRFGFSRASKFYLRHEQRIYDTKALVGAAYRRATGRKLANDRFAGGTQTRAVFLRIMDQDTRFVDSELFEDTFGELSNVSGEFDRLDRAQSDVRKLGFSKWIPLKQYARLHTRHFPGVYVIAKSASQPARMSIIDRHVAYIGETVDQNLRIRLNQFNCSLDGKPGHSGGATLRDKGLRADDLWLSIRSFPLGYGPDEEFAYSLRSSQIRYLERTLLQEYVLTNRAYPPGNSK